MNSTFLLPLLLCFALFRFFTIDQDSNVEKRLQKHYTKVIESSKLNSDYLIIFNSKMTNNSHYYKGTQYSEMVVYQKDNLQEKAQIDFVENEINFVLMKNNWYIHNTDLSKATKEEAINFCIKLENIILSKNEKTDKILSTWRKN